MCRDSQFLYPISIWNVTRRSHPESETWFLTHRGVVAVTSGATSTELHHGTDPHVSQDRLWVARFNGGAVGCYDPKSGQLVAEVRVPKEAGRQVDKRGLGWWKWRAGPQWDMWCIWPWKSLFSKVGGVLQNFVVKFWNSVKFFIWNFWPSHWEKNKSHFQEFRSFMFCFSFMFPLQLTRVDQVTSAAFGGETLQDLYLTTAREDFDEAKSKEFPWLGKSSDMGFVSNFWDNKIQETWIFYKYCCRLYSTVVTYVHRYFLHLFEMYWYYVIICNIHLFIIYL